MRDGSLLSLHLSSREVCFHLPVPFVYVFTLDIFEQRFSSNNILISVWENKSTSYFALSFPHRAPEALEEMV